MRRVIGVFVILQVASIVLYRFAAEFGDYGELWSTFPALRYVPFTIAQGLFVLTAEIVLIVSLAWLWYRRAQRNKPVDPLVLTSIAEHERLERKSTFRWDLKANTVNRALEKAVMKTVAAFMNSKGGNLLLGVGDHGEAIGVQHDYATLSRRDVDGLQNHFSNILSAMLGPSFRQHVRLQAFTHGGRECMLVSVSRADRPVYLNDQDREEFFIRTGNGTTALKMSEAHAYIASRFSIK